MAAIAVDLEAAIPAAAVPLPVMQRLRANDSTDRTVVRALPTLPDNLENMEHEEGLRHRLTQAPVVPQAELESPVDTEGTLTPGSAEEQQDREGILPRIRAAFD